jgi:nucleotide-binding universal stress UspA family protein
MYKRILVAIDGSATSDLALREAMGLAKDQNALLRIVHVVDMTPPAYMMTETASAVAVHFSLAEYQQALREAGEKLLTTRATTAREAGVNVDTKLITVGMLGDAFMRRLRSNQNSGVQISSWSEPRGGGGFSV